MTNVRVEIWSDVVCPWCYLGKARFEAALADFEHSDEVEVIHRSFELDTDRVGVEPIEQMLAARYGPQAAEMEQRVAALAEAEGLGYRTDREIGNTFDLHRVLHLARAKGLADEVLNALFEANFAEARPIFQPDTVVEVVTAAGLAAADVRQVLEDRSLYADDVRAEEREAGQLGARGVPFFVLDRSVGVSGGQSTEVFAQALRQAWDRRAVDH